MYWRNMVLRSLLLGHMLWSARSPWLRIFPLALVIVRTANVETLRPHLAWPEVIGWLSSFIYWVPTGWLHRLVSRRALESPVWLISHSLVGVRPWMPCLLLLRRHITRWLLLLLGLLHGQSSRSESLWRLLRHGSAAGHSFYLLDLEIQSRILSVLLTEPFVLLVDVEDEFLHVVARRLILVEVLWTYAQMQWFIAFLLSRALLEARPLPPQSQLDHLLLRLKVATLATNLDDSLHIAAFGPDESPCHLELTVVIYLDIKSASVLHVVILVAHGLHLRLSLCGFESVTWLLLPIYVLIGKLSLGLRLLLGRILLLTILGIGKCCRSRCYCRQLLWVRIVHLLSLHVFLVG